MRSLALVHFSLLIWCSWTPVRATGQRPLPDPLGKDSHSCEEYTCFKHEIHRVAVIGAGPAGLQAAAALIEHGKEVRLFERARGPGGNWNSSPKLTPNHEPFP